MSTVWSLATRLQRFMLSTERGALRPVWRCAHEAALLALFLYLRRGESASAYASGSFGAGEPVYGLSDIDLVVVAPGDPRRPGRVASSLKARWKRMARVSRLIGELFDVAIYEQDELAQAASATALTYGLEREEPPRAMYLGREALSSPGLAEGPGLYGPTAGWRRVAGSDRRPAVAPYDDHQRRIAVWLALQSWWRFAFGACLNPSGPRTPSLCVKLVAEPVRCWLWLVHGERHFNRRDALVRALVLMPEEEPALRAALELEASLPEGALAPLGRFLAPFVHLSSRIAARFEDDAGAAGHTEVRLRWGDPAELVLGDQLDPAADSPLLPLADWRALVLSWLPDEALDPSPADPVDPLALADAARAVGAGAYPALRHDRLLVLPTAALSSGRGRLRAVQCSVTDPVSWALLEGRAVARFPNLAGWSARDWARRAVAENRGWLNDARNEERALARPLSAARAAAFLESIEAGRPELALTLAAAARWLDEHGGGGSVGREAHAAYREFRGNPRRHPDPRVVGALDRAVRALPAFG